MCSLDPTDRNSSLMEHSQEIRENTDRVVDILERADVSLPVSSGETSSHSSDVSHCENSRERDAQAPVVQSSSNGSNARHYPSVYKTLISIKLTYKISLIITSIIVLIVSRHERPQNPLFAWIVGYTAGSAISIPIIFRHYFLPHPRLSRLVNHFKWLLEFFFALWFIIGNYWVFREDSSSQAGNLYRLCIALLVFNYIKYIGPFLLCAMVLCCCRGLLNKIGGASTGSINSLPTYKFKSHKNRNGNSREDVGKMQGGVVASGTERECNLVGEDAVCCICLASYDDNDELKELPCSHFFHASCVDTWLQIKAFCPLCKRSIGKRIGESPSAANSSP